MNPSRITATLLLASLSIVGCSKSDGSGEMKAAQDKVAGQASDAMGAVKSGANDAADKAKDAAKMTADQSADMANNMSTQIKDLMDKAQKAVDDKKWTEASGYVDQAKAMKSKLPEAAQTQMDVAIANVEKLIDAGKKLTPGM